MSLILHREVDPHRVTETPNVDEHAAQLIERLLGSRRDRTSRAYRADIEDFATFLGCAPAAAVARLLGEGPQAARTLAMDYAVDQVRRRGAAATIQRRLGTIRMLVRSALDAGDIDWSLEVPTAAEVAGVLKERASGVRYMLPRHPSEIHRLDVQHYAMQAAVGRTYFAPVVAPARVLDVGTGSGQWAFEVCADFPDALVIGLDLVPSKAEQPPGYRWVRANVLAGLPLRDARFDLVHQRFLASGIPVAVWPTIVGELVRVARPGGWIVLTESVMALPGLGPANARLMGFGQTIAGRLGLDTGRVVCDSLGDYLRRAGAVDVVRREVTLPIGRWGGQVGALMATNMRAACSRLCEMEQQASGLTAEESNELLGRVQEEWEQNHTTWTVGIAWGRRPG